MKDILVVEDDSTLAMGIEYSLEKEDYSVDIAINFNMGKELIDKNIYDLIILDVGLPDGNGFDLCKYIRKTSSVPVIFLTAEDEEVNIVMGLDIGGDDYITKPFRIKELISRIKAILRRTDKREEKSNILISKDIKLSIMDNKVYKDDEALWLTPSEYRLLIMFMNNPKIALSRSQILENLWDIEGDFVDDNSLSVYIRRLREKIEDDSSDPKYIKTVRGIGYIWDIPVRGE